MLDLMLQLNNRFIAETSELDMAALTKLVDQAFHVGALGEGADGFVIALEPGADYDSPNYRYFEAKFERFAYVDRIVVNTDAQGKGIGRALYEGLFAAAREAGHERVTCEVNIKPANPKSLAFHEKMGFEVIEEVDLSPDKRVAYLEIKL